MDSDLSRAIYASETAADDDRGATRFRVVRDFGDTLSTTFGFLRENGRELGLAIAAIAGPVALLANVASGIVQARMYASMADPSNAADPFAMFRILGSPAYLLAIALGMVAPFLVLALTFAYVRGYRRGEAGTLTPSRLWAEAKGMVGPLLLFYLATFAALMLGAAVNIIPCLGTLAYLAAMVYVFPVSSIAFVVRAEEGLGIVASWKRADALVRPHWGQSFGVTFLSWMLLMIVMIALAMVTLVPGMMAGGLSGEMMTQPPLALTVLSALAGAVIVLAYAIPFLASVFQYHTLIERAEGTGFGADIAALATPARAPEPDATFTARPAAPYAPPAHADAGFGAAFRNSAAGDAAPSASAAEFGDSSIAAPDPGFRDADGGASSTDTPPAVPPAAAPPSTPSETPPPAAPPSQPGGFRGGGFDDRTLRDL